jgi:hypothetical protein
LQLDDNLKNLLRELGHAINDTVSESERITGAIAGVRAHGYDIVLKLDATIQVDQESFEQDQDRKPVGRLPMTPQDVRFLKSLRIATDDAE